MVSKSFWKGPSLLSLGFLNITQATPIEPAVVHANVKRNPYDELKADNGSSLSNVSHIDNFPILAYNGSGFTEVSTFAPLRIDYSNKSHVELSTIGKKIVVDDSIDAVAVTSTAIIGWLKLPATGML